MQTIVIFLKDDNADNEVFPNPNISKIKISIEGKLNQAYSRDLRHHRLCEETSRYFSNKMPFDRNITVAKIFNDTVCVTINLRPIEDNRDVYGTGKRVLNRESGVLLEQTKSRATTKDHTIHCFVVSYGMANFINNDLQSIQY